MGWSRTVENGVVIHCSPEGYEVWLDHEWLDRDETPEGGYTGPMRKREGFLMRTPQGAEHGPYTTWRAAKKAARDAAQGVVDPAPAVG
jgi:hypothetical protein